MSKSQAIASLKSLESMELRISRFLRAGVVTSGIFMLFGWLGNYLIHFTDSKTSDVFETLREYRLHPLIDQLMNHAARPFDMGSVFLFSSYIGLFILISLPIIRVLLTSVLLFKNREHTLAWIAVFVLVALIGSFYLGVTGNE